MGKVGNDTIDRYPLHYREKLAKLLCISKEIFKKLRLTTREFYTQQAIVKNAPTQAQRTKALHKTPALSSCGTKETTCLEYTPTNIWPTRDSTLWQWRRAYEWWHEYGQDDQWQIAHEKRHILV